MHVYTHPIVHNITAGEHTDSTVTVPKVEMVAQTAVTSPT